MTDRTVDGQSETASRGFILPPRIFRGAASVERTLSVGTSPRLSSLTFRRMAQPNLITRDEAPGMKVRNSIVVLNKSISKIDFYDD